MALGAVPRRLLLAGVVCAAAAGLWWYNWHLARPLRLDRELADCVQRARLTPPFLDGLEVCVRDRYGWSPADEDETSRVLRAEVEYLQAERARGNGP